MRVVLVGTKGPVHGQEFEIPPNRRLRFGRTPESDIVIEDPHVSRIHCSIELISSGLLLRDNQSHNGTWVNGRREAQMALRPGDTVQVGPAEFLVLVQQDARGGLARTEQLDALPKAESVLCARCNAVIPANLKDTPQCRKFEDQYYCPKCTHKLGLVGLTIGRYKVLEMLGKGSIGAVYKAEQAGMRRIVALKVLHPGASSRETTFRRFLREATTGAQLNHPNIVQILDQGSDGPHHFIAMEFVDGPNLLDLIVKTRGLKEQEAARVIGPICRGLEHAHRASIIHRDIKPANIMTTRDGVPKLTDLGLAKNLEDSGFQITASGMVVGTPSYMAPEQITEALEIDHRADIFGLGAALYHAVTARLPFSGKTPMEVLKKAVTTEPTDPMELNPELSSGFADIIAKAMAKDREKRYETAQQLADALEVYA